MKKSSTLTGSIIAISVIAACSSNSGGKTTIKKPNIIVLLVDDAGYADFGFMGSKDFKTPNIDKLAAGGVIFTDAHVSATVCGPSRAGLMTGRYQQRFQQLDSALKNWEKKTIAPLWTEGAQWDTITWMTHQDLMLNRPLRANDPGQLKKGR